MTLIDSAFYAWINIIEQVVALIMSSPITASFLGMFVILIITNVISKLYDRNGERK